MDIITCSFQKFMKLEKVEIGGIRGKALTSNIGKVYEEFKVKHVVFTPPKRQFFQLNNITRVRLNNTSSKEVL